MSRLSAIALAAALALGSISFATEASARGGHGGHFGGGHFGGGHFGGFHRGFGGFGLGYGYGPGYYSYYGGCWRTRRVATPWGWRWRRINVCGYGY
jgi:hypothetical protein